MYWGDDNSDHVIIPDTVKIIDDEAFGLAYIKKVTIPNSVTSIGEGAFDSDVTISVATVYI